MTVAQSPGIATQPLLASGYGYAGEDDWKTLAMVRIMKVRAAGTSVHQLALVLWRITHTTVRLRRSPRVFSSQMLMVTTVKFVNSRGLESSFELAPFLLVKASVTLCVNLLCETGAPASLIHCSTR